MSFVSVIMAIFSLIAAIDRIFGSKLGLGKQFEKGFMMLGTMALSMAGMIIISPYISELLEPVFSAVYGIFGIDPSIIPASVFANDMGGAPLAKEVAKDAGIGMFNALIVSSMLGCTISFTIPFSLGMVKKEQHKDLLLGLLCGIVTIPVGCFVAGLMLRIPIGALVIDLIIPIILSVVIGMGLLFFPNVCVKVFSVFGLLMKALITAGLALGVFHFLVGKHLTQLHAYQQFMTHFDSLEEGLSVCVNAAVIMSGAFPLMFLVSKLLARPMKRLGKKLDINEVSALGFVGSMATSMTTFETMEFMDKKGVVLNSAFAVSGAFTFAGHLAFTLAFDADYLPGMIVGKLISGFFALGLAIIIYNRQRDKESAK